MEQYIFNETEWYSLTSNILTDIQINNIFFNKSVAIVGNSEGLLTKNYGNLIDSNDIVCRINRGIENTINNPVSVGVKTDVLFYSMCRTDIIPFKIKKDIVCIQTTKRYNNLRLDNNTFFYKSVPELKQKLNLSKKKIPSTGITAVDIVHQTIPKEINLYGFDFKKTPTYYHRTEWYQATHLNPKLKHEWLEEEKFILNLTNTFNYINLHQ